MTAARDLRTPLGRARMLFSLLAVPKLRRDLATRLSGAEGSEDPRVQGPLSRVDWLGVDGQVDVDLLQETADVLALMRSDQAVLEVSRLEEMPVKTEESRETSGRIARIVFERVGRDRTLTEAELGAAIAMFTPDVALVRRNAVDSGVLTRTDDGAAYRLAATE